MSSIRQKALSFLLREFYLFWAAGLTIGIYAGSRQNFYNIYIFTAGTAVISLMVIVEIIMIRKLLRRGRLSADTAGSSGCGKSMTYGFLSGKVSAADRKSNNQKLTILIVVPFLILLVIGDLIISVHQHRQSKNILLSIYKDSNFCSYDIVIEGKVSDHPDNDFGSLNFILEVESIYIYDNSGNLDIFSGVNEPLSVKSDNTGAKYLRRDDYLRIRGSLDETDFKEFKTGDCDYLYLASCGRDVEKIECKNLIQRIFDFRSRLYCCIKNTFYGSLKIENACIAEAVILGNRNNVPDYLTEYFKRCGVYHLFAISGLHISFFISLVYLLVRKIKPSFIAFCAAVIFLIIYNFLVGGKASTLRASVVFVFVLLAANWNREYNNRFLLYLSYIIMLLFNPCFLYDLGFWMSYGSMAALIFIYPAVKKIAGRIFPLLKRKRNYIIKIAIMTFSIQAVLFPILAYFFKEVSLISPVANILILPVFYVLLFILTASSFASIIWPPAGGFIMKFSAVFFEYILRIVKILGEPDFFILNFDSFRIKDMVIYYIVLLAVLSAVIMIIRRVCIKKSSRDQHKSA